MKPHVICHMLSSVDGRILGSRWRPKGTNTAGLFERLHDQLEGDAWIVGRVTGQEFSKRQVYPDTTDQAFPREAYLVRRDADALGSCWTPTARSLGPRRPSSTPPTTIARSISSSGRRCSRLAC